MAAVLAGTNSMAQQNFYFASGLAAVAWVMGYGLAAYSLGESFMNFSSPATVFLGLTAISIILGVPALILRHEKRLLAKIPLARDPALKNLSRFKVELAQFGSPVH
jgi:membrane protein DedA with SNARE-associated domain